MTAPLNWVRTRKVGRDPGVAVALANADVGPVYPGVRPVLLDRCTVTATGQTRALEAGSGTVRDSLLRGEYDGVAFRDGTPAQPSLVEDSHILGPGRRIADWHHDGVQLWTGGHLTIRRCVITGWDNSAVFLKTDVGPIDNVRVEQCVLACGSWFPIFVRDGGHGRPTRVTVTGCVFDAFQGPTPISTGADQQARYPERETKFVRTEAARKDPTWVVWSGNVRPDGTEIAPPGGWIG